MEKKYLLNKVADLSVTPLFWRGAGGEAPSVTPSSLERGTGGEAVLVSPEVRDIISARPGWIVRHGILLFFLILLLVMASTYFIKYPDVVFASAKLMSANGPKEVKLKMQNRVVKINVTEGETVAKNKVLATLESTADAGSVLKTDSALQMLKNNLQNGNINAVINFNIQDAAGESLGELQGSYQVFQQALFTYRQYIGNGFYLRKKNMLAEDISYMTRLHTYLEQQKKLQETDLVLIQKNYEANKSLHKDKVIADLEMRGEESKVIGKQMSIPQINTALTSNESNQHEKDKEIATLQNEIAQQKNIFSEAVNIFEAAIEDWKTKYLLVAPVGGKVVFPSLLQENQVYNANQVFCFINPGNTEYQAQVFIPQTNFGKVVKGQMIHLKFPSYPYQEFGQVKAELSYISTIPSDSVFVAIAQLNNGLVTNYMKNIQFKEGLTAQAEIITKNRNLLSRILGSLRSQIQ